MNAVQIIVEQGAVAAAGQGVAAVGALKWFGDRVFGPSADALGENLRAYLAERVSKVFAKAGEAAQVAQLEPSTIRPGLLARMIVDASFSEDVEEITKWWANLFVDASLAGSNEHAVFSDIMALIGPAEANCLKEFIQSFPHGASEAFGKSPPWIDTLGSKFEGAVEGWMSGGPTHYDQTVKNFLHGDPSWPMRPTEWRLFRADESEGGASLVYGHNPWYIENLMPLDILGRAGVIATLNASFNAWDGMPWVRGIGLTTLGYEFYRACEGIKR